MSDLTKPPLVEVIFELQWAKEVPLPPNLVVDFASGQSLGGTGLQFSPDDQDLFFGQFSAVARKSGFGNLERLQPIGTWIPHQVSLRYRAAPMAYPCMQIGLGVFTVNQTPEGYSWAKFRNDVEKGLHLLEDGHPQGLAGLPPFRLVLRYQDGFGVGGEGARNFAQTRLNGKLSIPFLDDLDGDEADFQLTFGKKLSSSGDEVAVSMQKAIMGDQPALVMDTIVLCPAPKQFSIPDIMSWLDGAHGLQQAAFESLCGTELRKEMG